VRGSRGDSRLGEMLGCIGRKTEESEGLGERRTGRAKDSEMRQDAFFSGGGGCQCRMILGGITRGDEKVLCLFLCSSIVYNEGRSPLFLQ
jgi:hypothetical protein